MRLFQLCNLVCDANYNLVDLFISLILSCCNITPAILDMAGTCRTLELNHFWYERRLILLPAVALFPICMSGPWVVEMFSANHKLVSYSVIMASKHQGIVLVPADHIHSYPQKID